MDFEKEIRDAVAEVTGDGLFEITHIIYDEKNFGNVLVQLKSNAKINVRFIKDRGDVWCEIGLAEEWFIVEDVLTVIGVQIDSKGKELVEVIAKTTHVIKENFVQIRGAFDKEHLSETTSTLKELATKRMMSLFSKVKGSK